MDVDALAPANDRASGFVLRPEADVIAFDLPGGKAPCPEWTRP
jgi:hypothetical protein